MEFELDGANVMHQGLQREMEMYNDLTIPSLQHVSIGGCSDNCEPEEEAGLNSDTVDTDFDPNDESDEEEEEEEEDEEDVDSGEDDSQIHDLIDDLEVKFRKLVFAKIGEAEDFFDDADNLQHASALQSVLGAPQNAVCAAETIHSPLKESQQKEVHFSVKNESPVFTCGVTSKFECSEAGTQTDDDAFVTKSSGTLVSNEALTNREESLEPEQARIEIGQLRDVRDSLVAQRHQWETKRKQTDEKNEEELRKAECKVYEIEEAIEAIETAIEFKNEIVIGQQPRKSIAEDAGLDPNEIQLVTRLESLSLEELRRLLCAYFAKVVELRYSSRRLEKNVEHIENLNEQISRRLAREHKHLRDLEEEYQSRIRSILLGNSPSSANNAAYSWYRRMDDQLAAARKKQHALEKSLTALLVRHGYLVNGADYEVKQVVKMLGIESQLTGTTSRTARAHGASVARVREEPSTYHSNAGWQKIEFRKGNHLSSRRNGRQLDGHELMRVHRESRLTEGWEREHREAGPPQLAEVRREKRRLIIQPGSGAAPSSSNYSHAGPSSHNNHHHSHPHHPNHGANHHGYK